jgi:hypothetical protein
MKFLCIGYVIDIVQICIILQLVDSQSMLFTFKLKFFMYALCNSMLHL